MRCRCMIRLLADNIIAILGHRHVRNKVTFTNNIGPIPFIIMTTLWWPTAYSRMTRRWPAPSPCSVSYRQTGGSCRTSLSWSSIIRVAHRPSPIGWLRLRELQADRIPHCCPWPFNSSTSTPCLTPRKTCWRNSMPTPSRPVISSCLWGTHVWERLCYTKQSYPLHRQFFR